MLGSGPSGRASSGPTARKAASTTRTSAWVDQGSSMWPLSRTSYNVTATDSSGNVESSPATFSWKVKRPKRR